MNLIEFISILFYTYVEANTLWNKIRQNSGDEKTTLYVNCFTILYYKMYIICSLDQRIFMENNIL